MRKANALYFILGILLLNGFLAQAASITINISGEVTDIIDFETYPYDEIIHIGDSFTGSYTYNTSTNNSSTQSGTGIYVHNSPYGFNISLGGFEFKTAENHIGEFGIFLYDNYSLQPFDRYIVDSSENSLLSTGLKVNNISWYLYDSSHTALSSTILPFVAPNVSAWSGNTFSIGCGGGANATFAVWGKVTRAEIIPEPATFLLLSFGGLLLRCK